MLKNISNLGSILNKKELENINGASKFEVCNFEGAPIICKVGHCQLNENGNWSCL